MNPPVPTSARPRRGIRALVEAIPRPLRGSPLVVAAMVTVVAWVVLAVFAPVIAPYGPLQQNIAERLSPPSVGHWFGTDPLGRDVLSRILFGARISIAIGIAAVALASSLGTLIGMTAGYLGGVVDEIIMRITDLFLSFPTVILAMVISAALGAGIQNAIIAIMIAWWPLYARFVRGLALSERERDYVTAATALGASRGRIIWRHVLRNVVAPILIMASLDVGRAIILFATLSFLGLGAPPNIAEWGGMVALGQGYFNQWWIALFPGLAILTLVMAFNVVGDALRDVLDPRYRKE